MVDRVHLHLTGDRRGGILGAGGIQVMKEYNSEQVKGKARKWEKKKNWNQEIFKVVCFNFMNGFTPVI